MKGSGEYPIERRAGEIDRLRIQNDALAAETAHLLDRLAVGPGWRCLDLGCGPRGITGALSERVGAEGHVTGLDVDPVFIKIARDGAPRNVTFVCRDAYATGLPDASFDLVHVRYLASTAGEPERLVAEARRLACAGAFVAFQESDFSTLKCYPPHPAWTALATAMTGCFPGTEGEPAAQRIYRLLRRAGLVGVVYRPVLIGVRSGDPWQDYLPATVESLRGGLLERGVMTPGELDELLAACRAHLAEPDTVFTAGALIQAWGRVPDAR